MVDDVEGKFEIKTMAILDRRPEDVAVNGDKIVIAVGTTLPSDVEIPLAEIWLIVFVVLNSPKSGKRREVAD